VPLRRALLGLTPLLALAACAELAPLREPPALESDDPLRGVTTRAEALARLGPPADVRAGDTGDLLVYRVPRVVDVNPNRLSGERPGAVRYELYLLQLDPDGKIVRTTIQPE
jgi:hypothetical protein